MLDDHFETSPPRIVRALLLLTLVVNGGLAITDAATTVRGVATDPSHPLLRPYRSGRFGGGPLVTPTRAGVTAWIILSRGVAVLALAGFAYLVVREEGAAAAGGYGAVVAVVGLVLCLSQVNPTPRIARAAPPGAWIAVRTAWLFACAVVAWWYALCENVRRMTSSSNVLVSEVEVSERTSFSVRRAPGESPGA